MPRKFQCARECIFCEENNANNREHFYSEWMHQLLTKDNLIGAFITGAKCADRHPGRGNARAPMSLALPVAAIVIAGTSYGATVLDPLAFTPRAHADAGEPGGASDQGDQRDD